MARTPLALVAALTLLATSALAQRKPGWDFAQKRAVKQLAERWWKARPATYFDEWDPQQRDELARAFQELGAFPAGKLDELIAMLWEPVSEFGPGVPKPKRNSRGKLKKQKRPAWLPKVGRPPSRSRKGKKIEFATMYGDAWAWLDNAKPGNGLILGLHGGGEGSGSADEPRGTWRRNDCTGIYPQGIKLVHDTWNTVHGERFLLTLIEIAKAHYAIDPDRVYSMGFSMGGTGSWFMAGRHPDLLAGAAPCAGVFMAQPKSQIVDKSKVIRVQHGLIPNVRNLAMYYYIGLQDRNCMPGTYLFAADELERLRKADPGGYTKIHFKTYPGLAHAHPDGEPTNLLRWLPDHERDPFPPKLVWETATRPFPRVGTGDQIHRLPKTWFYWLRCERLADHQSIRATRDGNEITLEIDRRSADARGIEIMLNERMIDPDRDVVVKVGRVEAYRGRPQPEIWTVMESLDAKVDRSMIFDRRIRL